MRTEGATSARARNHSFAAAALLVFVAAPCAAQTAPSGNAPVTAAPATSGAVDVAGTVHVCSSCHGPGGRSTSSTFPRLAGQQKDYLVAQLQAFRDHTRADPHAKTYMWGMAARLSDPLIEGIAAYYSSQPAVAGETPRRGRAGHWPYQARAPHGPQLSQRPRRRPHQCRARRRRLQLRSPPALADEAFARPVPGALNSLPDTPIGLKPPLSRSSRPTNYTWLFMSPERTQWTLNS